MNSVLLAREERVTMQIDEFYREVHQLVDRVNVCRYELYDDFRDPLRYRPVVYPPRVYEMVRKLKEQNDGNRPGSREQ